MKTFNAYYFIVILYLIVTTFSCSSTKPFYGLKEDEFNSIKIESSGGKLDFIKTLDQSKLYLMDGIAYNYREASLFLWGNAVKHLGISKPNDAILLYEEIKGIKLEPYLAKALKAGFNKKD